MSDTIEVTVTPIEAEVTGVGSTVQIETGTLGYINTINTKVITSDTAGTVNDEVVILNASGNSVKYTMLADPPDNTERTIVASDITNTASIDWNGKSFQGDTADFIFYQAYEPLRVRFSETLDLWVRV